MCVSSMCARAFVLVLLHVPSLPPPPRSPIVFAAAAIARSSLPVCVVVSVCACVHACEVVCVCVCICCDRLCEFEIHAHLGEADASMAASRL